MSGTSHRKSSDGWYGSWMILALILCFIDGGIRGVLFLCAAIAIVAWVFPWIYARFVTRTYQDPVIRVALWVMLATIVFAFYFWLFD